MNPNQPGQYPPQYQAPQPGQYQPQPYTQQVTPPDDGKKFKRMVAILITLIVLGGASLLFLSPGSSSEFEQLEQNNEQDAAIQEDLIELRNALSAYEFVEGTTPEYSEELMQTLVADYLNGEFISPLTLEQYVLTSNEPSKLGEIQYAIGARCVDGQSIELGTDEARYAIRTFLTSGASACVQST